MALWWHSWNYPFYSSEVYSFWFLRDVFFLLLNMVVRSGDKSTDEKLSYGFNNLAFHWWPFRNSNRRRYKTFGSHVYWIVENYSFDERIHFILFALHLSLILYHTPNPCCSTTIQWQLQMFIRGSVHGNLLELGLSTAKLHFV